MLTLFNYLGISLTRAPCLLDQDYDFKISLMINFTSIACLDRQSM